MSVPLTSLSIEGASFGKEIADRQGPAAAQICCAGVQSVPNLWPLTRLHAQIWYVPDLLPRKRAQGANSRCYQVQLVTSFVEWPCVYCGLLLKLVFKEERSERQRSNCRYADPHPQRLYGSPYDCRDAFVEDEGRDCGDSEARGIYSRLSDRGRATF